MNDAASSVTPHADVVALVVAADSGPVLGSCVEALLASPRVAQVRLADNASADGVPQAVALRHAGDARFMLATNTRNLGFGAAINRLAQGVAAPWLAIVNPDCLLQPDALQALLVIAQAHPEAGLFGALIVDEAGQVEPASRRRDPLLRRVLASLGLTRGEGVNVPSTTAVDTGARPQACGESPAGALHGRDPATNFTSDATLVENVEAISGALMLVRRDLFERLGGFDEGYFLHFEDLDLCRRVRDAGCRVLLAAAVRVMHTKGSSSRHRPVFVDWHKHRGMWRWLRKFDPALRNPVRAAATWCGIWVHFLVTLPFNMARRKAG